MEFPLLFHFSTHYASVDRRPRKISIDDWKELEKKQTETNDVVFTFFQMPRTLSTKWLSFFVRTLSIKE